jgi:ArsR family transcriptional regulator, arsenate/arsenite/antimonite-responsive transcriptional repressor
MAQKPAFDLERFFQALGDTTRLRLLNLMGDSLEAPACGAC